MSGNDSYDEDEGDGGNEAEGDEAAAAENGPMKDLRRRKLGLSIVSVHRIKLGSWPARLDTIDLYSRVSGSAMSIRGGEEEGDGESERTLGRQIDRVEVKSGVALRSGKAQQERGKEEGEGQHVDLVALLLFWTILIEDWSFDGRREELMSV